ncbi:hypothetical protein F4802DRAFT_597580 [Xylaria palmicola]|nr:hypothetical protein F4802DRAFT_597580 [Xylaria palmicola]
MANTTNATSPDASALSHQVALIHEYRILTGTLGVIVLLGAILLVIYIALLYRPAERRRGRQNREEGIELRNINRAQHEFWAGSQDEEPPMVTPAIQRPRPTRRARVTFT